MKSNTEKIRTEANLGPKNLWKAVKIINGTTNNDIPLLIDDQTNKVSTNLAKAELFSETFENKISDITSNIIPDMNQEPYRRMIFGSYEENWITEQLVRTILVSLPNKRCSGYDRIPLIFYKDGSVVLLTVITKLMQKVLKHKVIPEQWKLAKVIPVYKKGNKSDPLNYRPISNLCSLTKVFEKLVLLRLKVIEEREKCDLTGSKQHGFKSNRSTETAALEIQSKISGWCDEGEFVTVTSLDLTAAFDIVDHRLLHKRMIQIGLPNIIVEIIDEWLRDRSFYCEVKGKASLVRQITHGTVQGSILGPVLFAIFISGISEMAKNSFSFADENYILNHARVKRDVIIKTEQTVATVRDWLIRNGMLVNDNKTEVCIFNKKDQPGDEVRVGASLIKIGSTINVLGIRFDTKMTWCDQARHAMGKANKAKQGLALIRKYFNQNEALRLATAYFYSTLYYGAKVWLISTLHHGIKKQLWQISSRMLRIVERDFTSNLSYMKLHKKYQRATPTMWCNYATATAMWSVLNEQISESILIKMMLNHLHAERRPGLLFTRSNSSKIGFNCLSNRLQTVSNRLKIDWQDMKKEQFKVICKKTFILSELLMIH